MKKSFSMLIAILLLCISMAASAEEFSIRNGIRWGMSFDEVIERIEAEGLTITTKNSIDEGFIIICSGVPVSNKDMGMLMMGDHQSGLWMITYYRPDYSIKESKKMISDFDSFCESITKKYGKPAANYSEWGDDVFKGIYDEHTAANLGIFTKHAYWKTNTCFIDLCLNSDLKEIDDSMPGPTVWISYYPPEFADALINVSPNTDGL